MNMWALAQLLLVVVVIALGIGLYSWVVGRALELLMLRRLIGLRSRIMADQLSGDLSSSSLVETFALTCRSFQQRRVELRGGPWELRTRERHLRRIRFREHLRESQASLKQHELELLVRYDRELMRAIRFELISRVCVGYLRGTLADRGSRTRRAAAGGDQSEADLNASISKIDFTFVRNWFLNQEYWPDHRFPALEFAHDFLDGDESPQPDSSRPRPSDSYPVVAARPREQEACVIPAGTTSRRKVV